MKTAEEARFWHAAIVGLSQDAIISKNLDAVIVSWNAGAERIFGYAGAEAIGQLQLPFLFRQSYETLQTT